MLSIPLLLGLYQAQCDGQAPCCISLLSQGFPAEGLTRHYSRYHSICLNAIDEPVASNNHSHLKKQISKAQIRYFALNLVIWLYSTSNNFCRLKVMIQWLFYQQSYFWNLIFWNSHSSKYFLWILVTEHLQIFFMTPILHRVKFYLETEAILRITYSFVVVWVFFLIRSLLHFPLCHAFLDSSQP